MGEKLREKAFSSLFASRFLFFLMFIFTVAWDFLALVTVLEDHTLYLKASSSYPFVVHLIRLDVKHSTIILT